MTVKILRDVEGTAVEVIDIDAVISHEIEKSSSVSEHALEDGSTIADHMIRQPDQITVTGFVSSYPVTLLTGGVLPARDFGRARTAYQALKELIDSPERVTVQDELEQHASMAMTDLRIPRDLATYNGVQFTATFRKVRTVSAAEVEISDDDPIAKKAADVGAVTPDESTPEVTERASALYELIF